MKNANSMREELIAPCGMNCAICSRYLAGINHLKRSQCSGCRSGNLKCVYLFANCSGINNALEGNASARFCFDCDRYPCRQIDRMDDRYRHNYKMSVKKNLARIKEIGVAAFVEEQYEKYRCSECGGTVSIHNGKCFRCDDITKLVQKRD